MYISSLWTLGRFFQLNTLKFDEKSYFSSRRVDDQQKKVYSVHTQYSHTLYDSIDTLQGEYMNI